MMSACHAHVAPPKSAVRRCGPSLMLFRLGFAAWLPRSKIFGRDDERLHPLQPPLTAQVNLNCWRRDMGVLRWAECANFLVAAIQLCRRLRRRRGESRSTYALGADAPRVPTADSTCPVPGKEARGSGASISGTLVSRDTTMARRTAPSSRGQKQAKSPRMMLVRV